MKKMKSSTIEEIQAARELKAGEIHRKEKYVLTLARAKEELGKRLIFQSQHGDRVRATIRDRVAGEQVVLMNSENTRIISELKQQISQLELRLK